ncbi:unnamed protein product [Candidula unifasciata]|uniref:Uncharacterized protein n=1 Tax=Candidula unifasciata TaxID=100452 RepID=A0A8S3YLH2_9EUPU|nr:unnamed protein product [Candidula unifasciata]
MFSKIFKKRFVRITVCLILLQFIGYLKFRDNRTSGSTLSLLSENIKTWQLSQPAAAAADTNQVTSWQSFKLLIQEVPDLLNAQLKFNNMVRPVSVKLPCVPHSASKNLCVHPNCTQLSNNLTERIQSLISQKTILAKEQDDLLRSVSLQIPENDVILLSAASSNHYDEMQAMLHSLHSMVFPELSKTENFSLVLWDIGLTSDQRQKVEKCCRCQVISFPFEKFPKRISDLHTYMWKPLLIRITLLRARKFVVYHDACIRYNQFPGPLFDKGMTHGLYLLKGRGKASTVHRTLPETFTYLGQKVCSFYPYQELIASYGVYKNDPFVLKAVTNLWARCAFEEKCMSPRPTIPSLSCHYGPCHRFDQSALTIITTTLYGHEIYRITQYKVDVIQYVTLQRDHKEANYFNSTGCLKS